MKNYSVELKHSWQINIKISSFQFLSIINTRNIMYIFINFGLWLLGYDHFWAKRCE